MTLTTNVIGQKSGLKWLISAILFSAPALSYAACGTADVGGTAYLELPIKLSSSGEDANAYGTRQPDNELGVTGIGVKVTDSTGAVQDTTTDTNGQWVVAAPSFPVRVEYQASNHLYSGPVGAESNSSVQFISSANCKADLGLQYPEDYSQTLPPLLLPSYIAGSGESYTDAAVSSYPYNANASYQGTSIAAISEVGSLWGMAWQRNKKRIFGATALRRHVGLRDGLGYVYIFDQKNLPGSLVGKFDLQGKAPANGGATIDLGSVCRDATCATATGKTGVASDYVLQDDRTLPSVDLDAFFKVGRVGFGDADLQPNSNTLWLINTYQKALISVDVSSDVPSTLPGTVNQYLLANLSGAPTCNGGELRPWALGFNRGVGYLGLSCDASISQSTDDLQVYIKSFDPANMGAGLTSVYDFSLKYNRDLNYYGLFKPWLLPSLTAQLNAMYGSEMHVNYPQGVLSDIDFDEKGNIYTEVMDIFGLQQGHDQPPPMTQSTGNYRGVALGDLLKICKTTSGYSIEGTADCPASAFIANSVGPGGNGEFFNDHSADSNPESALGGLVVLKGSGELVSVVVDPHDPSAPLADDRFIYTQGFTAFSLDNGGILRWHTTAYSPLGQGRFGKSAGVGDLELLTEAAPIEIGNRVWLDTDADGIQDPDEAGVDGVEVQLQCSQDAKQSVIATTSNGGSYLFSSASNADFMDEGESCRLQIAANQLPLNGYVLSLQNADSFTDNHPHTDLRDSDAANQAGAAEIAFVLGNSGENNHTLDFGFKIAPLTDLALAKSLSSTSAKRGEQVIYTLTVSNTSTTNATNVQITDLLPAGLTYVSDDGAAVYGSEVYDAETGVWLVGAVPAAGTKVLNITVQIN